MSGEDDDRPPVSPPQAGASSGSHLRAPLGASLSQPITDSGLIPIVDLGAAPTLVSASSVDGGELDEPSSEPDDEHPPQGFGNRYTDQGLLGRGGMGEVRLARDQFVGRKVALKVIRHNRAHRPRSRMRFMREARIQGQLEHPAVVPVYDLAQTADGRPYFTMKRVSGMTLEDIISALRWGDPETSERYSRRRLLEAFARVCLAVDYVHQSGVLHRDLKPANIMLGRFGEVYVLDWGLAKLLDEDHDLAPAPEDGDFYGTTLDDASDGRTAAGELMGTPGYMAPEQIDGGGRPLDARADIYALGAILFELLTFEPLHPPGPIQRKLGSTIRGADARACERYPDREVPPELEAICVRATADDPEARYDSARALAEAIEAFLDGDRDLSMRRGLARRWATRAEAAAKDALNSGDLQARSRALEHASRALALDPNDEQARSTFVHLLLEPPPTLPKAAAENLLHNERAAERVAARGAAIGYSAWLLFLPFLFWMGVRSWITLGAMVGCVILALVLSLVAATHPRPEAWSRPASFVAGICALMFLGRLLGPLVLVPGLAATNTAAVIVHAPNRRRSLYLAAAAAAVLLPLLGEALGWLPDSYQFVDGQILIAPHLAELPRLATLVFLIAATVTAIVVPPLLLARTRDGLRDAERRLALHAWQMEQLLPRAARPLVGHSSSDAISVSSR
ncbi:serine/threonine-protein kinase [Paraliomyxa miuraensis]|uniref:serine/threonine-protein kinase n=1 Tax=Paraliomyxa miuraensis TaxID=376150 RepID=UPI00224CFB88|nr:serine/threonine-protein kinase [Paraliomyxa miuraensis]MCX4244600.1 serine/threonine protein kinase [Paraliomyxa miuraensis]